MDNSKMTLEEFREITKENPQGFLFNIICLKCGKDNVGLEINGEACGGGGGCETCGYGGEPDVEQEILFKCHDCGNAFHEKRD